jgi:hypothetical protein
MKKFRSWLLLLSGILQAPASFSQPVARTTVVEHFTNTFCSVCASRNPGFYSNLAGFPEVLHISYYPSAPYPACPFNQMNRAEQDARTNFYGIYGGTPRLVINGSPLPANASYNDPGILQSVSGQVSDFSMSVGIARLSANRGEAKITITKVADHVAGNLLLYAVVAEDTVHFNANNGETIHYDKFNRSLTGLSPLRIDGPLAPGDSVSYTFSFDIGSGWGPSRVTAILQDEARNGLQAARSALLPHATSVMPLECRTPLCMYPIPARETLHFTALPPGYHPYTISNAMGQIVQQGILYDVAYPIPLHSLQGGSYIITIAEGAHLLRGRFVKQ